MSRATVTENHRDSNGNAGMSELHGIHETVEEAKSHALRVASRKHGYKNLHWKQFSPTTWGVMNGQVYTFVIVSLIKDQPDT